MGIEPKQPISIYLSYVQKDEALKQEFDDYLTIMQQIGLISGWAERQIQPGTDWSQDIDSRLLTAHLILLFVSPGLLASGYFSGAEARKAFERRDKGEAIIIPIILHSANLKGFPIETLQPLPRSAPVSSWSNRSAVWSHVDQEIRSAIEHIYRRY